MMEELEVIEILSTAYDGDEFPGYENIRLSFSQLETIIRNKRSGWLDALRNQKAVYLITDTSNGKMYVGSATAQYGMLLQRWTNYIDNGHGGNVELKHIVDTKGFDYMYLFSLGEKIECLNKIYYPSVYKRFDALADFLGCSKKALAIRMKQLGLLKKEYLDNPFDLVTVYPEVSEL